MSVRLGLIHRAWAASALALWRNWACSTAPQTTWWNAASSAVNKTTAVATIHRDEWGAPDGRFRRGRDAIISGKSKSEQ